MSDPIKRRLYFPYAFMLGIYAIFIVFAFVMDSPADIYRGLIKIVTSKSILITDYIELGGIGATLINSVLVGCFSIFMMVHNGIKPNGAIIMAIWLTTGFAFFGKNVFNMLPITFGVWLFSKYQREPFMSYALASLLCATLSPVVSELSFMGIPFGVFWGILVGIAVGFVFPTISAYTVKVHAGYCLYNMGFSGGLIAAFIVCVMKSLGIKLESASIWNREYDLPIAVFLYLIAAILIATGIFFSDKKQIIPNLRSMSRQSGRLVTDFYLQYKENSFINMGLLCILGTTVLLRLGANLNGPTIGGIFTILGFGCFGKHIRNVTPILIGAILSTYFNTADPTSPSNTLAILFSTGLAPIAGQYGWFWGIVAGFMHVNLATNVAALNAGLNLYNNGFAGGFVAILLIPIITTFRREKDEV